MTKALIVYATRTGETQNIADLIAEGVRFAGQQAHVASVKEIKTEADLNGYDGYVFGSATYHGEMLQGMKTFLFLAERANLTGKIGGAFGSYTHSGESAQMIFDTMENVYKMDMVDLGALNLKEHVVNTEEGLRACQDYGRAIGKQLAGT